MRLFHASSILMLSLSGPVFALNVSSDWACEVALCLSMPSAQDKVYECREPLKKLWRELHKGRGFPRCKGADAPSVQRQGYEPFEPCPADMPRRMNFRDEEPICRATTQWCPAGVTPNSRSGGRCYYPSVPAKRRDKANYVEYALPGQTPTRTYY